MSYSVIWTSEAEQELTTLWLASRWRNLITESVDQIDDFLASNPNASGESRGTNRRIAFLSPLVVEFEVDEIQRTIYVRSVWQHPRGPIR
jgi:hypothetical protein